MAMPPETPSPCSVKLTRSLPFAELVGDQVVGLLSHLLGAADHEGQAGELVGLGGAGLRLRDLTTLYLALARGGEALPLAWRAGDFPGACARFENLSRIGSRPHEALLGLGDCRRDDNVVVLTSSGPPSQSGTMCSQIHFAPIVIGRLQITQMPL